LEEEVSANLSYWCLLRLAPTLLRDFNIILFHDSHCCLSLDVAYYCRSLTPLLPRSLLQNLFRIT
jgi:hypothetical protein